VCMHGVRVYTYHLADSDGVRVYRHDS
jgi:hypothetical protein